MELKTAHSISLGGPAVALESNLDGTQGCEEGHLAASMRTVLCLLARVIW